MTLKETAITKEQFKEKMKASKAARGFVELEILQEKRSVSCFDLQIFSQ